jgi:hypothetical protein
MMKLRMRNPAVWLRAGRPGRCPPFIIMTHHDRSWHLMAYMQFPHRRNRRLAMAQIYRNVADDQQVPVFLR